MKRFSLSIFAIGAVLALTACYSRPGGGGGSTERAIMSPAGFPNAAAATDNDEGVDHFGSGHWDISREHFEKALAKEGSFAEAHFNLGLALDQMGQHEQATEHFQKAKELAPNNERITHSETLKKHLEG